MTWKPANFLIANFYGPETVAGYVYRGLGLYMGIKGSPKGRRPPTWVLTHLGSGHVVCRVTGAVAVAFPIAAQIAELGDWSFDGLRGYVNVDPELPDRLRDFVDQHPKQIDWSNGHGSHENVARQIATARA